MRTTQLRLVAALIVLGGVLGWTTLLLFRLAAQPAPAVPWAAPGTLLFFAGALGVGAWFMYDRVHRRREFVEPIVAVRLLAMAKASALVGSLICGGYAGFGIRFLTEVDLDSSRTQMIKALLAAGAGFLVVVAALLLERACKVPGDRRDADATGGDSGQG